MDKLTDKAIARITEEAMQRNNAAITVIEEYLTSICVTDAVAAKLLDESKTLQGAFKCMETAARKKGAAAVCIPPDEAFAIVEGYFGITFEDKQAGRSEKGVKSNVVSIFDLM